MHKISDYFVIGDLHTAALICEGSIHWLCLPDFDSPSIFAHLLDPKKGGAFSLINEGFKLKTQYLSETAILQTTFEHESSTIKILDYMLPCECDTTVHHNILQKKIIGEKKDTTLRYFLDIKPDYAKEEAIYRIKKEKITVSLKTGNLTLLLPPKTAIQKESGGILLTIPIYKNKTHLVTLEYAPHKHKNQYNGEDFLKRTQTYWKNWVSQGTFSKFCREKLIRSAITLKLMQYYPTGALIAAPTTSLPEEIGGERNWDYRYTWIRDATFTLYAFYVLGYTEEAEKFFHFIENIVRKSQKKNKHFDLHLLYSIKGNPNLKEYTLHHLSGYQNSKPVRIGNGAYAQFQLDIYGSLVDAYYFMAKKHLEFSDDSKRIIIALVEKIIDSWKQKDHGIWEIRDTKKHYTYSKIMAWVGLNRGVKLCDKLGISDTIKSRWQQESEKIKDWIWTHCYDQKRKIFTQYPKATHQDATNFLFVLLRFLDKYDPLTQEIIRNTEKELLRDEIFVYRYHSADGLNGSEGAFVLCSFWRIASQALLENVETAELLFDKFEKYMVGHGLMAEEIDPISDEYLGNYPQAFSHIGYIISAYYIDRYRKKLEANGLLKPKK